MASSTLLGITLLAGSGLLLNPTSPNAGGAGFVWNERAAEHLLNRASFGATADEVKRFAALGQDAAIESLFPASGSVPEDKLIYDRKLASGLEDPAERLQSTDRRRESIVCLQAELLAPMNRYGDWWVDHMLAADDPVRDHMTLFWHGHLVSSVKEVGDCRAIIDQIAFLRENALGRFEKLLRGIARDPAMLRYLNNENNVKEHPNENWARELFELFSLGDGNYTENDIKESARAFTGWSRDVSRYEFHRADHDFGPKTVLGVTGNLDGDDVIDIILAQPACGQFLSKKLIAYFEGTPPDAERTEEYAAYLRDNGYDFGKFLRKLFHDPRFYRDEVVGHRVAGPIEYLVGASRRLGVRPPPQVILSASDVLGQRIFWPPSVKGWEGGMTWINTASLMHRSNMVGAMLGVVGVESLVAGPAMDATDPTMAGTDAKLDPAASKRGRNPALNLLATIQTAGWKPEPPLATMLGGPASLGAKPSDAQIVERLLSNLLAVAPAPGTAEELTQFLADQRREQKIADGSLLSGDERAQKLVRRTAHVILSLPEAQLN